MAGHRWLQVVSLIASVGCQSGAQRPPAAPAAERTALTLLNGRVQCRVPWKPHGKAFSRVDENQPPALTEVSFIFPGPFLTATSLERPVSLLDPFPDHGSAWINTFVLEGTPSLEEFSSAHRLPGEPGKDVIMEDAVTNNRRIIITGLTGTPPFRFECYAIRANVGVRFVIGYKIHPEPPSTWVTSTLAQARAVCSSIRIVDRPKPSTQGSR
jgi:hypothetical protein